MKVTWYTNACVRISVVSGANILCDPWVNPGAFLGSWFQWPPLPANFENELLSEPCNGIYISHLHPDHYDPKFLAKYTRINPNVPVYIAEFAHSWLKRSVSAVVDPRSSVIEIPALGTVEIDSGFTLKVFAADTCNPKVCGTNIPCQTEPKLRGIDSIGVFRGDGLTVLNANDGMGVQLVSRIAANVGKVDLIMGHYGGASPFPQCFPEVSNKAEAGMKVVEATCKMLISAAEAVEAKKIMPFAGQYILGGKLTHLNDSRATLPLDEAAIFLRHITEREVVTVVPGGFIDLTHGLQSASYIEPSQEIKNSYLEKISKVEFNYEKGHIFAWDSVKTDLIVAASPIATRSAKAKIGKENSFVIGDGSNFVTINLDPKGIKTNVVLGNAPIFESVTTITMPTELLRRLSTRVKGYKGFTPMHWNQADVGSHFTWQRQGDYDLASHSLLNFFGV
jgi:UDP-MurNAc hydroxylase